MKVGIVTIFGDNYGNKLQNLAVQKIVEKYDIQAETILVDVKQGIRSANGKLVKKFAPNYIIKAVKSRFKNKYLYKNDRDGIFKSIIFWKEGDWCKLQEMRKQSFARFTEKHLKIANNKISLTNTKEEWISEYDFFISGSDQVWNPTYPETSSIYFLQFAEKEKRIALAPSIGLSKLPEYVKPLYTKWISEISHLSVREEKGAKIIKELTGRDAVVLADPTLCVSREEWEKIEEKPSFDTEAPYVFTYFLGNETNRYRNYIEKYAKSNGCKVINIFDLREPEYYVVNPAEFIYLIHHAKAVFTDSFHGSVFSILMNTPFVVFDRIENGGIGMSSRIETLLKTFSFGDRKYPLAIDQISSIDFSSCDDVIEGLTIKMNNFLNEAFSLKSAEASDCCISPYVLSKKEDCSGCTVCAEICPHKCIEMKLDEEGFYYPIIDESKCVHCNLCRKNCPAMKNVQSKYSPTAYVGYTVDKRVRKNSSSGGIFSVLAEEILLNGGWVYGVAFDELFVVKHIGTKNKADLEKLRGSKYVQSDLRGVFPIIKEQLNMGEIVYFSGTPCQVEGLLSYLGKEYKNLYTQDIICHGVPSPKVWESYLGLIKGKKKEVSFRNKKYGWHYFSMYIRTDKKRHIKRLDQDTYIRLFLDNVTLRPSCYACHFKKEIRNSDFTLADCWNGKSFDLNLKDDDKGLSMIFVNSEKGKKLFKSLCDKIVLEEVEYQKALKVQGAATQSVKKTEQRAVFFESSNVNGYKNTIQNWYGKNIIADIKKTLIYVKTKMRNIVKRGK